MSIEFDLVVRGGTIVDGTGAQPYVGDVGVKDGVISQIGQIGDAGREEIDATGLVVTPGFVDVHTHFDGQITWENRMVPSSNHGVTTVVMGNCGVGFAPVREGDHQLMIKLMEGVEDIPEVVMAEGVPFNWSSFSDYLDILEQRESDVDFATQIPHSPLRVYVMGERGANLEPPTTDDLAVMRKTVSEAIAAGALGVSSSRNLFHRFRNGKPAPSVNTELDEILALAQGLADAGAGVFQCNPNLANDAKDEMDVFRTIAQKTGRPVNFSLIHLNDGSADANWQQYVDGVRQAARDGLTISGQFLPRPLGALFGLDLSFHPFSLNPSYRAIANLPLSEKVSRMRDPELRARLIAEEPDDPNPAFVGMIKGLTSLYKLTNPVNYNFSPEKSLEAEAKRQGRPAREVIYDALLEDEGRSILATFSTDVIPYLEKTAALIGEEGMVPALGDGGAHYGMVCDAAYTTFMLANRVGDRGVELATAVRSLTSQPAKSVGLEDRGIVAVGYKADINVLDLDHMVLRRPQVKTDLPAGGKRLSQQSTGYVATVVSGAVTYRNGEITGALPGRLVRGARSAPVPAS